jgi:hypothetical protein
MSNPTVQRKAAQVTRLSGGTRRLYTVVNGVVTLVDSQVR